MKKQTSTRGKAFTINQATSIYGTFAEIGAGQETVNHFFKAGLASQTIAKSMSAYDMVFSDEIYGKQNRYVSKDRVITMLDHEYKLLQRRLRNKSPKKCFFSFANTATTSSIKKNEQLKLHYSWMGVRFQTKPQGPYNEVTFHVNCLDQSRLQQHEALGILGVNLIYSCFHYRKDYKTFLSSLTDNLHNSRIEISSLTCTGSDLKHFEEAVLNIELLNQHLSPLVFFDPKGNINFISDTIFNKNLSLIYNDNYMKDVSKEVKKISTSRLPALILSRKELLGTNLKKKMNLLSKGKFYVLIPYEDNLSKLKKRLKNYTEKKITLIISKNFFLKNLFSRNYYDKKYSFLNSIGFIFDSNTIVKVFSSQDKSFSIKKSLSKSKEKKVIDYLITNKKLSDF